MADPLLGVAFIGAAVFNVPLGDIDDHQEFAAFSIAACAQQLILAGAIL